MSCSTFGESETWIALLLGDASFPGGSLANSQGLESAILHGVVAKHDIRQFQNYIDISLEQVAHQSLPFLRTAYCIPTSCQTVTSSEQLKFHALDQYCHAFLSNDVSRRASTTQGKCFLRVVKDSFPEIANYLDSFLTPVVSSAGLRKLPVHVHFAPIFGIVCKLLHISMDLTDRIFLRMFLRDLVSAGIRLNMIGPIQGVRLQVESFQKLEELIQLCSAPSNASDTQPKISNDAVYETQADSSNVGSVSDIPSRIKVEFYQGNAPVQSAPIIDILQSRHDLLYSRLFNS